MEKTNKLYHKWWFWVLILLITIVLGITSIILYAFAILHPDKNLNKLAKDLQSFDSNISVYQTINKESIIIKYTNETKDEINSKCEKIGNILNKHLDSLALYNDIEFYMYSNEGYHSTLYFDIKTKKFNNDLTTDWVLIDSQAQNEEISILGKQKSNLSSEVSKLNETKTTLSSNIKELEQQKVTLTEEIKKSTTAEDVILSAGNYVTGEDIKPGKYDAIAQAGKGNLFVHGTTRVNETLGVNDSQFYIPTYKNITLKQGDTIEITSNLKVLFQAK